jgi:hypothetical protein
VVWHLVATARAREGAVAVADDVAAAARADAAIIPANPRNMHLAETLAKRLLEWTPGDDRQCPNGQTRPRRETCSDSIRHPRAIAPQPPHTRAP